MKLLMNAPGLVHASDSKAGQVTVRPKKQKKQQQNIKKNEAL
jgi:hypothetical protein